MKKLFLSILLLICISGVGFEQGTIGGSATNNTTMHSAIAVANPVEIILASGTYNKNSITNNRQNRVN